MEGLPIYILVDTSGSMHGEPIMSLQNGLQIIIAAFSRNFNTFRNISVSVISFGDKAELVMPMTDINEFVMPQFNCYGCTALGDAFSMAANQISEYDLSDSVWKPIVFVMTDGEPTDDFALGLVSLRRQDIASVVVCLASQEAVTNAPWITEISENIVNLDTADSTTLLSYAMKFDT